MGQQVSPKYFDNIILVRFYKPIKTRHEDFVWENRRASYRTLFLEHYDSPNEIGCNTIAE